MYKHKSAFFSHSKGVYVSKKKIWEKKKKKKFSKEKIIKILHSSENVIKICCMSEKNFTFVRKAGLVYQNNHVNHLIYEDLI